MPLVFAAHSDRQCVRIQIEDDDVLELTQQSFTISASPTRDASRVFISPSVTMVTILDDEGRECMCNLAAIMALTLFQLF